MGYKKDNHWRALLPSLQEFRLLAQVQQPELYGGEERQATSLLAIDSASVP